MISKLKKIYKHKDKFDIYNKANYFFTSNPIYKVNKFITNIDEKLTKNFKENLEDILIVNDYLGDSLTEYDHITNTLYCNRKDGDIFGLLHVASNDRTKPNSGIIIDNDIGYGINNGLTEVFKNDIEYNDFSYQLEATIAKTLLMIDSKLVTYSYFNNDGEALKRLSNSIKALMIYTDLYHNNNIKIMSLYNQKLTNNIERFKTLDRKKIIRVTNERICKLETENINNVSLIFGHLINIIKSINLEELEKQDLYIRLYNEFDEMFKEERYNYLNELTEEFDKHIYVKKR